MIGAAYTSVSFLTSFSPKIEKYRNYWIIAFIVISTFVLAFVGRPAQVLVFVGTLNGLILPISLGLILLAAHKTSIVGDYKHPVWMTLSGAVVVLCMAVLSAMTLSKYIGNLFG